MTKRKINLSSVQQDYNRFISAINSNVPMLSMPYVSIQNGSTLSLTEPLVFIIDDALTLKHVKPCGLKRLEVTIEFLMTHSQSKFDCYYKNMLSSNVNVKLRAINSKEHKSNYFGFHFDLHKHQTSKEDTVNSNKINQLHPKYHTQFLQNPLKKIDFNYGDSLELDIPRFTHFPMDFILATGFVLANFAPHIFEELKENIDYLRFQKLYQENLWRPYIEELAQLLSNPNHSDFKIAHQLHPYWII